MGILHGNGPKIRYMDLKKPKSRHDKPFKERMTEIRNKWRILKTMMQSEKKRCMLHPVMLYLGWRLDRSKYIMNLTKGQKIRRKYEFYRTLPRFRPFFCQKCGLSSHNLLTIKAHMCRRRTRREPNSEEVQRAIENGIKSGLKNSLRTMETLEFPGKYKVELLEVECHTDFKDGKVMRPKLPNAFIKSNTVSFPIYSTQHVKLDGFVKEKEICYLCLNCGKQFFNYEEYDLHLYETEECAKPNNEMGFIVDNHHFPLNYCKLPENEILKSDLKCLACGKLDFSTMPELQKHVLHCTIQY
ncbi:unnamed protein product [Bursaphelenchus okinawaensis]|uniref:C2H2-type domain-containing protein n=1 Tax=Bursaphelenchus okinawaensis TaxID=465554 RepID=A0A811K3G0_9BILA|nr:unnamed protein product [Bursaphelenchus okinawaensis]CAG9091418.1 unnamed protein product [Bursaphelenchus okinawaensis]